MTHVAPDSKPDYTSLFVVGGRQRRDAVSADEWQAYDEARVLRIDLQTEQVTTLCSYRTPTQLVADERPSILFKAATLSDSGLWVCTTTEVLQLNPKDGTTLNHWSHPWFNDLHHVVPTADGKFWVADTGLDAILKMNLDGEVEALIGVGNRSTWERFDRSIDYRKVPTTKPHETHPNFVFQVDGRWWATRYLTGDAICLSDLNETIRISEEPTSAGPSPSTAGPHDGIVWDSTVAFTTVDGKIVRIPTQAFCASDHRPNDELDSSAHESLQKQRIPKRTTLLDAADAQATGWCRGLLPCGQNRVWVGFSRIRPTAFRSHVSWIKHGFRKVGLHATAPTRVALHHLETGALEREIDLEPHGLAAVFSIHPAP